MLINDLVEEIPSTNHPLDSTEVQLLLGQMYLNKSQFSQAFSMFAVAAQSGQPQALNMLGRAYEQGWGVTRSVVQAVKYFEAAAEQGYGWAHFNLGDLYLSGDGLSHNLERAFQHYVQAACCGVNKALNMLGTLYENGLVTGQPDQETARLYFLAGAEAQDCWAAFNMGRLALEDQKHTSAAYWFEQSLMCGFPAYWIFIKNYLQAKQIQNFSGILAKVHTLLPQYPSSKTSPVA